VVTLSESSRREIVSMLGLHPERVSVVAPGIDPAFGPGGLRAPRPLVVAVGRLVPVKRFDLLMDALVQVRRDVPGLRAVIVGEGYERARLEAHRAAVGADGWVELPGYLDDDALRGLYRRAWVLASASQREGWGMTISEAGACATPSVVSRIAGHLDAVVDGEGGLLVDLPAAPSAGAPGMATAAFADALRAVLGDRELRARLGRGARRRARTLSWEATAAGTLEALVEEAEAHAAAQGRWARGTRCSPSA
jgi:glycosyltransferase involved in cell wall biosynthesis